MLKNQIQDLYHIQFLLVRLIRTLLIFFLPFLMNYFLIFHIQINIGQKFLREDLLALKTMRAIRLNKLNSLMKNYSMKINDQFHNE